MTLIIRPVALGEVDQALDYYYAVRDTLGDQFGAELEAVYQDILARPLAHPEYEPGVREAVLKSMPHSVYYRQTSTRVIVVAVRHHAQAPLDFATRR